MISNELAWIIDKLYGKLNRVSLEQDHLNKLRNRGFEWVVHSAFRHSFTDDGKGGGFHV